MDKQPWEITDQIIALLGIVAIAVVSLFWLQIEAKEIAIGAVGVLGGYIGGKSNQP